MMDYLLVLLAIFLPMLLGAFVLGWHFRRRQDSRYELSPVTRQHMDLFQGRPLSQSAVDSTKARFQALLERGDWRSVEASLRPGTEYVVGVHALAAIGTEEAGRILERQLQRRQSTDALEQSWYRVDVAECLRNLQRDQSLPQLLRCAEAEGASPLSHFFAAETVCFVSFAGYLRQAETPLGRSALRVLHRALEGLRSGVQPQLIAEARLGEVIEDLWDNRPDEVHPLVVRVFTEGLRVLRRAPHARQLLAEERSEQEALDWQLSRLTGLEVALEEYLREGAPLLGAGLALADAEEQRDRLLALADVRGECAPVLLPLLEAENFVHRELAVACLTWSRDGRVGPRLREWIYRRVPVWERARQRRRAEPPRRSSVPEEVPYATALRALRGHPSEATESLLRLAARDGDPTYRAAAVNSLGWWEPIDREAVIEVLQEARRDVNGAVRLAARGALARLGERRALAWFRQALGSQDSMRVHEAIHQAASEGLVLLWPDLDRLVDADAADVSLHASEALEQLREEMDAGAR
jgi:hypothetical protein